MASSEAEGNTATKSFIGKIASHDGPLIGTVLTIASTTIAQLVAQSEGEIVMIDMEHAPLPIDTVTQMVAAYVSASRGTKFPLVRVPSHGVEWVKWALDSGAAGIIVPMVNNAAEMKAIIDRAIYPPGGRRSFGPLYAQFADPDGQLAGGGMAGYFARAKRGEIALLPMIESKAGLANVEEIMSLDGVSGVLVGPADLRLSLGLTAAIDGPEPEFAQALEKIMAAGRKLGKVVGGVALGEEAIRRRANEGVDFLLCTFDFGAVVSGVAADLKVARQAVGGTAVEGSGSKSLL